MRPTQERLITFSGRALETGGLVVSCLCRRHRCCGNPPPTREDSVLKLLHHCCCGGASVTG